MDRSKTWEHIHHERAALAEHLAALTPDEWEHESLCPGWTVKDVTSHLITNPKMGWGRVAAMTARHIGRGGYNTMIFREVKRQSALDTPESLLADFARFAHSTRKVPVTTSTEVLVDTLVHSQDILRPLGRRHDMPPEAAAVAADRVRLLAPLMGTRRIVRSVRMTATDVDWTRGSGPTVEGPMAELLMLCSGRRPDADLVSGDGCELLAVG